MIETLIKLLEKVCPNGWSIDYAPKNKPQQQYVFYRTSDTLETITVVADSFQDALEKGCRKSRRAFEKELKQLEDRGIS